MEGTTMDESERDAEYTRSRLAEQARKYEQRVRELVEEHPVAAVATAVAIGWVLGRLIRR